MNLFAVVLQELIENMKLELGNDKAVDIARKAIKDSGINVKITDNGVVKGERDANNEDSFLFVFSSLKSALNRKLGAKKTKELFKKSAREVIQII